MNNTDDIDLRAWLAERDTACTACGYNLRGCESVRCPECGGALRLLELRKPRMTPAERWWMASRVLLIAALIIVVLQAVFAPAIGGGRGFGRVGQYDGFNLRLLLEFGSFSALLLLLKRRATHDHENLKRARAWFIFAIVSILAMAWTDQAVIVILNRCPPDWF